MTVFDQILTIVALLGVVAAGVVVPMAIADSAGRFGAELRKWAECEDDDDDDD